MQTERFFHNLKKSYPWPAWRPGTAGHLAILAFALLAAVFAHGWRVGGATVAVLTLALWFCPGALVQLRSRSLWLLTGTTLVGGALFLGKQTTLWHGIPYSPDGLALGAQMALRVVMLVIAVAEFTSSVSIGEVAELLERIGLPGLGFALGVAVNALPFVYQTVEDALGALRLRGGFRCCRWQALRLLLLTIVVNTVQHSDEVVAAAEARAFNPARRPSHRMTFALGDRILAGGLALLLLLLQLR